MLRTARRPAPLLLLAILAVVALAAGACGGDSTSADGDTTSADSGSDDGNADGAFPVTIEHAYGSTTIDEVPERIVSLETAWTDVLATMDHPPIGYIGDPSAPDGFPWRGDVLDGSTEIAATTELPWEQIAAMEPDLIVVGYFAQDQGDYDRLTAIAPTIALLGDSQVDKWQDLTTTAGRVLGEPAEAQAVIESVDGDVAEVAETLPGLKDRTFSFANYVEGDGIYVLADPEDGANVLFGQLGMVIPEEIRAEADQGRLQLSMEQIGMLDGDLLLALLNGTDPSGIAGWAQLPAVESGAVVEMDYPLAVALNTPTPLSIPWALEQIRPQLELAAG